MGLVIFAALAVYLIVLVTVTWLAYRWAARRGLPRGKRWLAAAGGFLLVYVPVFWDHIPTIMAHKYYCGKDAGFWVYKTVEQWKAENPGVLETLVAYNDGRSADGAYILNQRFNWAIKKSGSLLFNRWRWEQQVVDTKTNEILARYVDFSTGNGNIGGEPPVRFWLQNDYCTGGEYNQGLMYSFEHGVRGRTK